MSKKQRVEMSKHQQEVGTIMSTQEERFPEYGSRDFKQEAADAAAVFVHKCMFQFHRGILDCEDKVILFGNDGYGAGGDNRARREVELVREGLAMLGLDVEGFGTDGHTRPGQEACSGAMADPDYQRKPSPLLKADLEALVRCSGDRACVEKEAGSTKSGSSRRVQQ